MAAIVERTTSSGARRLYLVFGATDRATGKQRQIWELVPSGVKAARARKAEIEVGLARSGGVWPLEAPTTAPTTLASYSEAWLNTRARQRVSQRVLENYERSFRLYINPALGSLELGSIGRKDMNDFVSGLADRGQARNTIKNNLAALRAALFDALDDGLIESNPAARIRLPENAPVLRVVVPTPTQLAAIIEAARSDDARDVIRVTASLGLRRGETFGLTWQDVDFDNHVVHVHATNYRAVISEGTKSRAGTRIVPLFKSAEETLLTRKLRLSLDREGLTAPDAPVFADAVGRPLNPHNWYRTEWRRAAKAAGCPEIRFHALRHFAASRLDEQGMSNKLRSAVVGHSDPRLTDRVYTHIGRERIVAAASAFDPLISNAAEAAEVTQ